MLGVVACKGGMRSWGSLVVVVGRTGRVASWGGG